MFHILQDRNNNRIKHKSPNLGGHARVPWIIEYWWIEYCNTLKAKTARMSNKRRNKSHRDLSGSIL